MNQAKSWAKRGREIAAETAEDLLLPSGVTIKARRPGPALLASLGALPFGLAAMVTGSGDDDGAVGRMSNAKVIEVMTALRTLLTYCVVSPRIAATPGPDEIAAADVPNIDVEFIIAWVMRGDEAKSLAAFRQYFGVRGAGGDGADVRDAAVMSTGDRGSSTGRGAGSGGGGGVAGPAAAGSGSAE